MSWGGVTKGLLFPREVGSLLFTGSRVGQKAVPIVFFSVCNGGSAVLDARKRSRYGRAGSRAGSKGGQGLEGKGARFNLSARGGRGVRVGRWYSPQALVINDILTSVIYTNKSR